MYFQLPAHHIVSQFTPVAHEWISLTHVWMQLIILHFSYYKYQTISCNAKQTPLLMEFVW